MKQNFDYSVYSSETLFSLLQTMTSRTLVTSPQHTILLQTLVEQYLTEGKAFNIYSHLNTLMKNQDHDMTVDYYSVGDELVVHELQTDTMLLPKPYIESFYCYLSNYLQHLYNKITPSIGTETQLEGILSTLLTCFDMTNMRARLQTNPSRQIAERIELLKKQVKVYEAFCLDLRKRNGKQNWVIDAVFSDDSTKYTLSKTDLSPESISQTVKNFGQYTNTSQLEILRYLRETRIYSHLLNNLGYEGYKFLERNKDTGDVYVFNFLSCFSKSFEKNLYVLDIWEKEYNVKGLEAIFTAFKNFYTQTVNTSSSFYLSPDFDTYFDTYFDNIVTKCLKNATDYTSEDVLSFLNYQDSKFNSCMSTLQKDIGVLLNVTDFDLLSWLKPTISYNKLMISRLEYYYAILEKYKEKLSNYGVLFKNTEETFNSGVVFCKHIVSFYPPISEEIQEQLISFSGILRKIYFDANMLLSAYTTFNFSSDKAKVTNLQKAVQKYLQWVFENTQCLPDTFMQPKMLLNLVRNNYSMYVLNILLSTTCDKNNTCLIYTGGDNSVSVRIFVLVAPLLDFSKSSDISILYRLQLDKCTRGNLFVQTLTEKLKECPDCYNLLNAYTDGNIGNYLNKVFLFLREYFEIPTEK